jgi:hypothetical protein
MPLSFTEGLRHNAINPKQNLRLRRKTTAQDQLAPSPFKELPGDYQREISSLWKRWNRQIHDKL